MRVFLCHSSQDKAAVRQLYEKLSNEGFDVWLDEKKLLPGQDWKREIGRAIRSSDTVIICLSSSSITKSGYVQKEIKFALDAADEKPDGAIFLIPARLEECNVPDRLMQFQWVNLFEIDGYFKLTQSLHFAESKKEESNNIALEINTNVQTGISTQAQPSTGTSLRFSQDPQHLTIIIRATGDAQTDRKRIVAIYSTVTSYLGKDAFSFQIFEKDRGYLIDFPEAKTQICADLLIKLNNMLGNTSPFIVERIVYK